jgi:DNA-binding MarR family transcriptional regulator
MSEPLELCYCQAARRSARFLSRLYDRHLAPAGINVQQLSILSTIENDPGLLIADLADRMVMERTTLVRALKPLQDAGLVVTKPSGTGRSLMLNVSRRGCKIIADAIPLWEVAQREFETLFGADRAIRLRKEMQKAAVLA